MRPRGPPAKNPRTHGPAQGYDFLPALINDRARRACDAYFCGPLNNLCIISSGESVFT